MECFVLNDPPARMRDHGSSLRMQRSVPHQAGGSLRISTRLRSEHDYITHHF